MDEFCADWAHHQKIMAQEQARLAGLTSAVREARRALPSLIQTAMGTLAKRLGSDARLTNVEGGSPFLDSRSKLSFGGVVVAWDIEQHMSDHEVELDVYSSHPRSTQTLKIEVLSLKGERDVHFHVLNALRGMMGLGHRQEGL